MIYRQLFAYLSHLRGDYNRWGGGVNEDRYVYFTNHVGLDTLKEGDLA